MSSKIIRGHSAASLAPVFDLSAVPSLAVGFPFSTPQQAPPQSEPGVPMADEAAREAALAEAVERGRHEGRIAASAEHARAAEALMVQIAKTAANLAREAPRLRRDAESDVVRLALAIAKRVIHREISLDPNAIQGLVRVAIDRLNSRDIIRVRTHPSHREVVASVLASLRTSGQVELSADPALAAGDLIFETSQGELDASIESQLKEIELGIADRLGR